MKNSLMKNYITITLLKHLNIKNSLKTMKLLMKLAEAK